MIEIPANPDIAQKYHAQILGFLNTRLTETYHFYTPIIAALTGFGWAWLQQDDALLIGAFVTAITLLVGTLAYTWTISYTYRNFQLTLEDIEKFLHLTQFAPGWSPSREVQKSWKANRAWMVPEILKPIVLVLFTLTTLVSLGFGLKLDFGMCVLPSCTLVECVLSVAPVALTTSVSLVIVWKFDRYYYEKLQKNQEERQRRKETKDTEPHGHQ